MWQVLLLVLLLPPLLQGCLQLLQAGLRGLDGTLAKAAEHADHALAGAVLLLLQRVRRGLTAPGPYPAGKFRLLLRVAPVGRG